MSAINGDRELTGVDLDTLRQLFDPAYVQARHPNLFPKDVDPFQEFCRLLPRMDIDPSPLFDSRLYRYQVEREKRRRLVAAPLLDYLQEGYKDKSLLPNILFDAEYYRRRNDVDCSVPELAHYRLVGDSLGYWTHPLFCAGFYNSARSDKDNNLTALEHFFTSPASQRLVSHPRIGTPLSDDAISFVNRIVSTNPHFDPDFYRELYPVLSRLTDTWARIHHWLLGRIERRPGSSAQLLKRARMRVRDFPLGFVAEEYQALHHDLKALPSRFIPLVAHYLRYGHRENRAYTDWNNYFSWNDTLVPRTASSTPVRMASYSTDVCILMHVYYPELFPELLRYARHFEDFSHDIFVNIVSGSWSEDLHREVRERAPNAHVLISNDGGRDIGGFVRLLENIDIEKYEFFAWMHTKKSPHIPSDEALAWRNALLDAFAGNRKIAADTIALMRQDSSVGMIGSQKWRSQHMGSNAEQFGEMLDLFEIEPPYRKLDYLSGTMFFVRSEIVRRLYDVLKNVQFERGDDASIEFNKDGQLAHAVERVIGNVVRQLGYRVEWV